MLAFVQYFRHKHSSIHAKSRDNISIWPKYDIYIIDEKDQHQSQYIHARFGVG